MDRTSDNINFCFVKFKINELNRINEPGIWTLILELDFPNSFSFVFMSIALLISSLLHLSESLSVKILWLFWRHWRLIAQIYRSILFHLLSSFLVFVRLFLQLYILSINAIGMKRYIIVWIYMDILSHLLLLFLVFIRLLSRLPILFINRTRMRESLSF